MRKLKTLIIQLENVILISQANRERPACCCCWLIIPGLTNFAMCEPPYAIRTLPPPIPANFSENRPKAVGGLRKSEIAPENK